MMPALRHWLALPEMHSPDERHRAQTLYRVLWAWLVSLIIYLLATPFTPRAGLGLAVVLCLALISVLPMWLVRRGQVQASILTFVGTLWLVLTTLIIMLGGLGSIALLGYVSLMVITGLLLDQRSNLLMLALVLTGIVGLTALHRLGWLPPLGDETPLVRAAALGVTLLVTTLLLTQTVRALNQALNAAQKSNQALQTASANLEKQVAERTRSVDLARKEAETANQALKAQMNQILQQAQLNDMLRGEQDVTSLAVNVVRELCLLLEAPNGALFLQQDDVYRLFGSYAYNRRKALRLRFAPGEGLVGQAALEHKLLVLDGIPPGYMAIQSGLAELSPRQVVAAPFSFDGQVIGVVELSSLQGFTETQLEFLQRVLENVGVAFGTAQARQRVNDLLAQTRRQAEQLQQRESDLKLVNEALQAQTESLRLSQERLQSQQASLEIANAELEEKTSTLQQQRALLDQQNRDLRQTQEELQRKAEELSRTNQYKSEFLANMSHELRTPLNSLLILSRMLANNDDGNLTDAQVKSAQVIFNGGNELLGLINDILDLSKVEAGRMDFHIERMLLSDLLDSMQAQFVPVVAERGLKLELSIADDVPQEIDTDPQRLRQVIKNLLANAIKFTDVGSVILEVTRPTPGPRLENMGLTIESAVALRVRDTGIGIPAEKRRVIFEAFQQADGSTSRKYGGTGLGLTIAREMMAHLGGYVELEEIDGPGSSFVVVHPIVVQADRLSAEVAMGAAGKTGGAGTPNPVPAALPAAPAAPTIAAPAAPAPPLARAKRAADVVPATTVVPAATVALAATDALDTTLPAAGAPPHTLLVIEDDKSFARILRDFAIKKGFQCLLANSGEAGLELARQRLPQAIILDLNLPGISGWQVLDEIKSDPALRHIPVHIMSVENESLKALQKGVLGFVTKPVSLEGLNLAFQSIEDFLARRIKTLLVVEADPETRSSLVELLAGGNVLISQAENGQAALDQLVNSRECAFDCMILDLSLPDMTGFELLERMHQTEWLCKCPIIVYTNQALSEEENRLLMQYTDSVIIKGAKSPERLLDETALFLHRISADLPASRQLTTQKLYRQEDVLRGKKILIVDDDMRNSFALSRLLGEKGILVEIAPNGQKALDRLEKKADIDLVLMDVMMPVMDGLEATQRIRKIPALKKLPILALTAKAMKGDREQCMEAGANDYLSKPVDPDRLFSMLRVWLYEN